MFIRLLNTFEAINLVIFAPSQINLYSRHPEQGAKYIVGFLIEYTTSLINEKINSVYPLNKHTHIHTHICVRTRAHARTNIHCRWKNDEIRTLRESAS